MSEVAITAAAVVAPAPLAVGPGVATFVAPPDGPPPLDHLPDAVRIRATRTERFTQLALAAAGGALAERPIADPARAGIVVGTAFGCFLTNAAYQDRLIAEGPGRASPRLFAATVSNAAAGEIAIAYALAGPTATLSAGGASGVAALGHAADLVRRGAAEVVLAGGADAVGEPLVRWLAAAGLAIGRPPRDGAALVVLERACAGTRALGTIAGWAAGFEPSAADAGDGLAAAIVAACADADVDPAALALVVEAAPPALAALEARALASAGVVTARRATPKTALGETFAAAAPLGLVAALAATRPGDALLVLDVCASGHVGALVARRGA